MKMLYQCASPSRRPLARSRESPPALTLAPPYAYARTLALGSRERSKPQFHSSPPERHHRRLVAPARSRRDASRTPPPLFPPPRSRIPLTTVPFALALTSSLSPRVVRSPHQSHPTSLSSPCTNTPTHKTSLMRTRSRRSPLSATSDAR